jgi:IS5 family transposase
MGGERYQEGKRDSFFGDFVYERVVPKDHFLVKLNEVVPWHRFTYKLVKYYRGKAKEGRPPYDPAVLLKMLLVSYLYDISERQTEEVANLNLAVKYFLGLGVDEAPPDHSTLTALKRRIIENGKVEALEKVLREITRLAQEEGIRFGGLQIVDSVHTVADVNVAKDDARRREGKPRRDPHARWGVKGSRRVKDEHGRVRKEPIYCLCYKSHVSINEQTGLITSVEVTSGNAPDGKQMAKVVEQDLEQGVPVEIVAADRGYDDTRNHYFLKVRGIASAICLKDNRTEKKDPSKRGWIAMKQKPEYLEGQRRRYKIERKFGEAKQSHGLGRCRYVGLLRYRIQVYMTILALNLKRMVKLLSGVNFKGRARLSA